MPPQPKSPQSKRPGAPKAKGAVRAKSGCYTCRIRRKRCDEQVNNEGSCQTCVRLRLQCLGFGAKRPDWLRESRNVVDLREKIKGFLASQGMIKGHSGAGPRSSEQEPQVLALSSDFVSAKRSPQTPTLSISSTDERPSSTYPLRQGHYSDSTDHIPDSPLDRSEYPGVLLPPYSASSVSLDSASCKTPWPSINYPRPHTSDFSRLYTANIACDADYPHDVSSGYLLTPSIPYNMSLDLNERENASLRWYMANVLRMQYLHADNSLDDIIWKLIHTSDTAREAACLLSNLHRRSTMSGRIDIMEQDVDALQRMHRQIVPFRSPLTEGDALAGLCIISYFLFSGGKGQWQAFLDAACTFSLCTLQQYGGPRRVLLACSESLRFIIKTSMWFDVLASATLVRAPKFLEVIRELFDAPAAYVDGNLIETPEQYSMMSVMGCENHIVLALAEIANLAAWKDDHIRSGNLSVPELVRRGQRIEQILKKPSLGSYETGAEYTKRQRTRWLTSEVFRASAYVYLHSVISGDYPQCPEIIEAVNETVRCLKAAEEGQTGRAVVRSVVFSICICGCLTEDGQHRRYFLKRLQEEQQRDSFGNCTQVELLIREVWKRRRGGSVDWRQVMREAEMLLV
ncbi:fungal-specific transcription factor domain-containing protein [Phlebopus sp. FC_14]|nr:fungal-specific transcription factor domain-containing protein [Phlebopus sp. FC_14]